MVTDEMVEKAVNAALKADIIPADDPKHSGVRIDEYLSYTPAEAVELGVHLTQKTEDGKPRWHGFTDIMGDEYDDTNRAILRPVIRAALEAALSAAEPVAWQPRYKQEVIDHHKSIGSDLCEYAMTVYPTKEQAQGYGYGGHECRALYAEPQPAPSVAVKALHQAATDFMHIFIQDGHLTVQDIEDADLIPAYEKLSAALSAQVQDVAGGETTTRFHIEWIAGARPPVHPKPMTGRTTFETFERALQHMKNQADDAQFVSLEERRTTIVSVDRSKDMRAMLAATPAKQEGA